MSDTENKYAGAMAAFNYLTQEEGEWLQDNAGLPRDIVERGSLVNEDYELSVAYESGIRLHILAGSYFLEAPKGFDAACDIICQISREKIEPEPLNDGYSGSFFAPGSKL